MKGRVVFYDILRVLSIFAIIIMHVIGNTINTLGLEGTAANVYNSICQLMYFAVPMFIMISGALFLNPDKEVDIKKLYKKYVLRIVICLLVFGIAYSMLEIYFNTRTIGIYMISESIRNIFTGNLWAHMWYLYLIIGLYMINPLLKVFTRGCTRNEYKYVLFILFIFTVLLKDITKNFNINIAFNIPIASSYVFFYMLGDYLSRFNISKRLKNLNYVGSIIFITLIVLDNFIDILNDALIAYTSVMMSSIIISMFLFVKNSSIKLNGKVENLLKSIGECGLGIYLIHQFIINIIYKVLKINFIKDYPYIGLLIYVILIFSISYLVIYLLRKIKLVKKYIL